MSLLIRRVLALLANLNDALREDADTLASDRFALGLRTTSGDVDTAISYLAKLGFTGDAAALSGQWREFIDYRAVRCLSRAAASWTETERAAAEEACGRLLPESAITQTEETDRILLSGMARALAGRMADLITVISSHDELTGENSAQASPAAEETIGPASDADDAVRRLGREWATYAELAALTGKSQASVRSALKRADDKRAVLSNDRRDIPEARPGTARVEYRIRAVWPLLKAGERSRESSAS